MLVSSDSMYQSLTNLYELGSVLHQKPEMLHFPSSKQWNSSARFLIAVLDGTEAELLRHFDEYLPGRAVGLIRDVCMPRLCGLNPLSTIDAPRVSPAICYAIVCTPRSGSTYLCSLLGKLPGGGCPREHLRSPAVYFAQHRVALGFDVGHWVDALVNTQTRDGVFGTKIISHFLTELLKYLSPQDLLHLESTLQRSKIVHLVRRNRYEQAVSGFLAKQTAKWHFRSAEELECHRCARRQVKYDFNLIKWQYERYMRMEHELEHLLGRIRADRLTIYYEDLVKDPHRRISEILGFLHGGNCRIAELPEDDVVRSFDEVSEEYAFRFGREMAGQS